MPKVRAKLSKRARQVGTRHVVLLQHVRVAGVELRLERLHARLELAEAGKLSYDGIDQTAGYMIQEINGERAVYEEDSSYWAIYVNGEYGTLGINAQPVTDGDEYKFVHEKF